MHQILAQHPSLRAVSDGTRRTKKALVQDLSCAQSRGCTNNTSHVTQFCMLQMRRGIRKVGFCPWTLAVWVSVISKQCYLSWCCKMYQVSPVSRGTVGKQST